MFLNAIAFYYDYYYYYYYYYIYNNNNNNIIIIIIINKWLWDTVSARPPAILTHASVEVKSTPGVYMAWLARRVLQDTSAIRW